MKKFLLQVFLLLKSYLSFCHRLNNNDVILSPTLHMCKMKKLTLFVFLIFVKSKSVKSKLSKAMKTFHDASEEDNTVMKERTTIPYQKLRNILSEESPRICTESRDYIYRSNLTSHSNKYSYNAKFWVT